MKKIITISSIMIILFIIITSASSIFSFRSQTIDLEERIQVQYVNNKSNYDDILKIFQETELQTKQYKDIYMDLIKSKYNNDILLFKKIIQKWMVC